MQHEPRSDLWWVDRLLKALRARPQRPNSKTADSRRYDYSRTEWFDYLEAYRECEMPLARVSREYVQATRDFLRMSRVSYADTIVSAMLDRVQPVGARLINSPEDTDGDDHVRAFVAYNGAFLADALECAFTFGEGYVLIGGGTQGTALATAEDPRTMIVHADPRNPRDPMAALKIYTDEYTDEEVFALYLRDDMSGRRYERCRAYVRPKACRGGAASSLVLDEAKSFDLVQGEGLPIVTFRNPRGRGEFEQHLDLIDRIINGITDRLWASKFQVFMQRALIGNFPDRHPDTGEEIDYSSIFTSDPASLWRLPPDASVWESKQLSLSELISPVREDVKELAMASRTPLPLLTSDSANQSATGVDMYRDGIGFKVEDRMRRWGPDVVRVARLGLIYGGQEVPGELEPIWAPAERESTLSRAQSGTQARAAGVPLEGVWSDVMHMPPETVRRWRALKDREALMGYDEVAGKTP